MTMLGTCFRSGMTSKSDMRGAIEAGVPIGVVALSLSTSQQMLTLPGHLNRGGQVFIDSGAFTADNQFGPQEWNRILNVYDWVASMTRCPENLHVVAPDVVGNQSATLALLQGYRGRLTALMGAGCHVIVPLQCGELAGADMLARVTEILGSTRFVAGIPSNKAAMSIDECATLDHHAFHILGRVQLDGDQPDRIAALCTLNPNASITADANWLRSRLSSIQRFTQEAHDNRDDPTKRGLIFDHPRVMAVTRALQADRSWGSSPAPKPKG